MNDTNENMLKTGILSENVCSLKACKSTSAFSNA